MNGMMEGSGGTHEWRGVCVHHAGQSFGFALGHLRFGVSTLVPDPMHKEDIWDNHWTRNHEASSTKT